MERLTIDEVIEHCNKTCDMTERIAKARGHELESIESKQFWEHYQVREWFQELQEYKKLEEQGLLLKVHCNVGSTVWVISKHDKQIKSGTVFRIVYENDIFMYYSTVYGFTGDDVGKTVFLTEEGAKQALKQIGE